MTGRFLTAMAMKGGVTAEASRVVRARRHRTPARVPHRRGDLVVDLSRDAPQLPVQSGFNPAIFRRRCGTFDPISCP